MGGTGGSVTLGAAGAGEGVAGCGVSSNCKPGADGAGTAEVGAGVLLPFGNAGGVSVASSWSMRLAKSGAGALVDSSGWITRPASVPGRGVENGAVGSGSTLPGKRVAGGSGTVVIGSGVGAAAGGILGAAEAGAGDGATAAAEGAAGGVTGAETAGAGMGAGEAAGAAGVLWATGGGVDTSGAWPATGASASTSCTVRTTSSIPTCDLTR